MLYSLVKQNQWTFIIRNITACRFSLYACHVIWLQQSRWKGSRSPQLGESPGQKGRDLRDLQLLFLSDADTSCQVKLKNKFFKDYGNLLLCEMVPSFKKSADSLFCN